MSDIKPLNIENYKDLFHKSPLGIYTATIKGRYIEVNETLAHLLGYSKSEELLKVVDISNEIYGIKGEREKLIKQLQKDKNIITHETLFRQKTGTLIPVRIYLTLIKSHDGESFVVGMVEDIMTQISSQQAIIREKQNLLTLIENLPDYIYFKDSQGNLLIANKSVRELISGQEKQNDSKQQTFHANDLFEKDDVILKEGGKIPEKLLELEDGQGKKHIVSVAKYPISSKKEITGLIAIGRDLTELKQAEKQIIESQANLHALIESSDDLIWSIDIKYKLITFNSSFVHFIKEQYNREIREGMNVLDIFPSKEKEFWKNSYSKVLKGEQVFEELSISTKNFTLYFECSFNPIFDKSLKVSGMSVILADISERKLAEHAIRESEERFRQLAENTSDAFILWDNTGILYANPAFEKIFGISIEEAMSDASIIENMIAETDRIRFVKNRKKESTGKQKSRNQQYILKRHRRTSKLIWARHYPVYNVRGKIYRYVTVTSDLTEQKQLEEVLTATRSQQQALLDNIPFLAWLKDKNGRFISVNTPFADYYKQKPEDIIGKTDFDLMSVDLAVRLNAIDQDIITSGEKKHVEEVRETAHGKEWIEIYKSPIFNEKGELIGLTGISRDITDRKRLEETIIKNEEHFRALLQYSSDAITILDKEGIITFESSLKNRILNFSVEELVGKPFKEIIHPEDISIYEDAFKEIFLNPGIQIKKEFRSLHKNRKWIYVESIFSNHLDNPSINGIVINTRDISDRKMAELKERAYHNNLIFLSNSALELLSLSDREDIYKYIGDKLFQFLENAIILVSTYLEESDQFEIKHIGGFSEWKDRIVPILGHSPIGMTYKRNKQGTNIDTAGTINAITDFNTILAAIPELKNSFQNISGILSLNKVYNITLVRNNKLLGSILIITLNKTIVKFKHIIETFAHQVAVALHRSQLEFELTSAKEKAEESDRLKTAFLANMSHEIRTPMNGILGFAEMLNDETLSDIERRKYLDIINNNGKILINLIDDIIDFAKIEAGQIKIVKHDFSVNALLSQIYNSFLNESFKKDKSNVKLQLKKGLVDDASYLRTDPIRLRQIITNLVGNAFKFTSEGFIEFGYTLRSDNFLEFFVKDSGIGIHPDKLELIFERFVQADNSRSRRYSGSGLGLAISKGFAELLGGTMWATSELNKGSAFYFSIPFEMAQMKKKEDGEAKKPKSKYDWSGKRILVAEDDFFSFKFLEGFLKQTNAEVLHADDGQKAVKMCSSDTKIDIILMDVQMPEMNGLDATREIKKFRKSLPIIAQTANAIAEEKQKCFEAGFDDFVTKPINITELFLKIDTWILKNDSPS